MGDDLCKIGELNENAVVDALEDRYIGRNIYTRCGIVLLAFNPYSEMGIYGKNVMQAYFNNTGNVTPHIYDTAESSYRDLSVYGDQTIIISGESGSGKTESTKLIINYLLERTGSDGVIGKRIEAANTILEAFGNAKTSLNDNSSRFGKRIRLMMDEKIAGAEFETYLLEKSRVTHREPEEKNFHIFYQLCASRGLSITNDFIDTSGGNRNELSSQYSKFVMAMKDVGVENIEEIENGLLGILHLGFIRFSGDGTLKVVSDEHFRKFCSIYNLLEDAFAEYLVKYSIHVRGEVIEVFNTRKQATTIRNSIARLLYSNIFNYVTECINKCLSGEGTRCISVLDIFGFETFANNGFDQFCVNWTNERIQNEFIRRVFRNRQEMYKEEGIEWMDVEYSSNDQCILDLEKPCGLVDLINEESFNAWGNAKNLGTKIRNYIKGGVRMKGDDRMVISHYAGDVEYNLESFLDKNRERGDLRMFRNIFISKDESRDGLIRYFKESMDRLFHSVNSTQIKYVRCIKPNFDKKSGVFDRSLVLKQLVECGALETIKISKQCFAQEMSKETFRNRYGILGGDVFQGVNLKEGSSKYFMDEESLRMLEVRRDLAHKECSRVIRMACRDYLNRRLLEKKQGITFVNQGENESCSNVVSMTGESGFGIQKECDEKLVEKRSDEKMDPYEMIRELQQKVERYKKFCETPCRNCSSLAMKYKFQSEALRKKNMIELELEKYKARVEYLERRLEERDSDEDSQISVSFTNSYNVFSCLIQLYLEFVPAFSSDEVPKSEIIAFAHSAFYAVNKLGKGVVEGTICMVDEINLRLDIFERNIHKVSFVLSNLVEYAGILRGFGIRVEELENLTFILFKHLCELQKSSILEVLPHSVLEHQQLSKFRCHDGYLKKIFRPPSISKLIRLLEYFYYQMDYYHIPEPYVMESINYTLKTINTSVFNGLLIKKNFLSFNRGVQINYNVNEIDKFCRGINYIEGMLNLAQLTSTIRLINLVEAHATADAILNECSILNCVQIKEIVSKFDDPIQYSFGEDNRTDKFLPEPTISLPVYEGVASHSFVCPRYLPTEGLLSILKSIR